MNREILIWEGLNIERVLLPFWRNFKEFDA
jgi:hypothetical protein